MKYILMILMVISLPFSESLKTISVLLLLFLFIIQLYKKELVIELSLVHYGFIFFFLSALISSMFAENPDKSLKGAKDILFYTIPFFAACSISNKKHIRKILWSLYISTAVAAVHGIFHSITTHKTLEIHSLGNQNYTAMYLIIVIASVVSTIMFSGEETKLSRIIMSILASLLLIAAVMTAMRTSILSFFIFIVILFFGYRHLKSFKIISLFLLAIFIASMYFYEPMLSKFLTTQSLISRMYIWQHAFNIFKKHPIVGIGLNHFEYTFPSTYLEQRTLFDAHSIYFQTASQMGLLGTLSLLLIIYGFIYSWTKFRAVSSFEKVVKYSALGGFLVTFVGGIFDTTFHHEHAMAFTLLAGLYLGNSNRASIQKKNKFDVSLHQSTITHYI